MAEAKLGKKLISIFLGASVIICLVLSCLMNSAQLAYAPNMVIDGENFFRGAEAMIQSSAWIISPETYHSAGMQVLVSWIFRFFGSSALAVKLFNYFCYLVSLVLIFRVGDFFGFSPRRKLFASAMLASCALVQSYCGTLQYEIFAMMLMLAVALSFFDGRLFVAGVLAAIICLFRIHLLAALIPFAFTLIYQKNWGRLIKFARGFLGVFVPVFAVYAFHFHRWDGIQEISPEHYRKWLCMDAEGWNYPYVENSADAICGIPFVTTHPLSYFALLMRRLLYWTGLKADIWWVPLIPWVRSSSKFVQLINDVYVSAIIFLSFFYTRRAYEERNWRVLLCFAVLAASALPLLVSGGSTRFLVPEIPFLILLLISEGKYVLAPDVSRRL